MTSGHVLVNRWEALGHHPELGAWPVASSVRLVTEVGHQIAVFEERTPVSALGVGHRGSDGRPSRALHFVWIHSSHTDDVSRPAECARADRRLWRFPQAWTVMDDAALLALYNQARTIERRQPPET